MMTKHFPSIKSQTESSLDYFPRLVAFLSHHKWHKHDRSCFVELPRFQLVETTAMDLDF